MAFSTIMALDLPYTIGVGVRGANGASIFVPPGSRVAAYVRSTGISDGDPPEMAGMLVPTINAGLSRCRAGKNDMVLVLPGHTEIAGTGMFTSAPAGSRVIGIGSPDQSDAPTITFPSATSNLALASANLMIMGMRFNVNAAAANVTEAITITAAGIKILGCYAVLGGATYGATTFIGHTAGNDVSIMGNTFIGGAAASDPYKQSGTTAINNINIKGNRISSVTSGVAVGVVQFAGGTTGIATDVFVGDNYFHNKLADSTSAISFTNIAHNGIVENNLLAIEVVANAATSGAAGLKIAGTGVLIKPFGNYVANASTSATARSAVLTPLVLA